MDLSRFYEARPVTKALIGTSGAERGRVLSATVAFSDLLACAPGELDGAALVDFVHPEDRTRSLREFCRLTGGRRVSFDGIGRLLARDGMVRWLNVHASLTPDGERVAIRVFALPVRLLPLEDTNRPRTGRRSRLSVELDLEETASMTPPDGSIQAARQRRHEVERRVNEAPEPEPAAPPGAGH
ncbi:MAG TPA: PAS domain-containing protein [Solirubrobacteraceae bacterium]|nr:PAS domain-containing protein [Solirubrobacteraceae bacterium]